MERLPSFRAMDLAGRPVDPAEWLGRRHAVLVFIRGLT